MISYIVYLEIKGVNLNENPFFFPSQPEIQFKMDNYIEQKPLNQTLHYIINLKLKIKQLILLL
jgi:hypothetical protein